MIFPPDTAHPVLEKMARDLYLRTDKALWPAKCRRNAGAWERISPELRAWFRDRARQFAAGDMRVAPWVMGG